MIILELRNCGIAELRNCGIAELRINLLCMRSRTLRSWQKFRSLWRLVSNRGASWRCPGRPEDLELRGCGPSGRSFPEVRCQSPTWAPWNSSSTGRPTSAGCDPPPEQSAPSAPPVSDPHRRRNCDFSAARWRFPASWRLPATPQPILPDAGANSTAISSPKSPWAVAQVSIKRCLDNNKFNHFISFHFIHLKFNSIFCVKCSQIILPISMDF